MIILGAIGVPKIECISAMLYECGVGETSSPFGDPSCRGSRTVQRTPCICSSIRCCLELNFCLVLRSTIQELGTRGYIMKELLQKHNNLGVDRVLTPLLLQIHPPPFQCFTVISFRMVSVGSGPYRERWISVRMWLELARLAHGFLFG